MPHVTHYAEPTNGPELDWHPIGPDQDARDPAWFVTREKFPFPEVYCRDSDGTVFCVRPRWKRHDGGPMPVDGRRQVRVWLRGDLKPLPLTALALAFRWTHEGVLHDVIAWQFAR